MIDGLATVIEFPARATRATAGTALGTLRRVVAVDVDDWGRDANLVDRFCSLARLRWTVSVGGTEHLPRRGGVLIVVNARRLALTPVFTALSVGRATARPVRFVGRPDVAPVGPALQRLGGLLASAGEVVGALRAGEAVVVGADRTTANSECGPIDHRFVGAALTAGAALLPAAAISSPNSRAARVEVGAPVRRTRRRRGPLEEVELADALRTRIDELLAGTDPVGAGSPLDWVGWVGGWARTAMGTGR